MLESIASAILSKVLGDYVKGFEAKNLKFSWSGELTLKNLELSTTALDSFDLPIKVKSGTLGKLHMTIPWRELGTKPSIIRIERLFIIAGPRSVTEYDEETALRHEQLAKERKLQYVSLLKQARAQAKEKVAAGPQNSDGFVKRLVTTIVNNLQVYIEKIHIRYEDDITNSARTFAFGVTLEHLHAQSTDEKWRPAIGTLTGTFIYKLISLKNLAVYWNPDSSFLKYSTIDEMNEFMESLIWCDDNDTDNVYILEPISGELKLVLNKSDIPDVSTPKARAKFVFDRILMALKESQWVEFISLIRRFVNYKKGSKFRKWRPKVSVKENPRAWWTFVGAAVLSQVRERREKWRWEYMKQRRIDKMAYIKLYKKVKKGKSLNETEQQQLKVLETKLSFEDILFFRTLTEIYLKREQKEFQERPKRGGILGWFASWFSKDSDDTLILPYLNVKLGEAEWKEIYDAIQWQQDNSTANTNNNNNSSNDNSNALKPPPDWIQFQADFRLGVGSVAMQLANGDSISRLTFDTLQLGLILRDKWITFVAQLDSLEMTDYFTKHSHFPQIVTCQHLDEIAADDYTKQKNAEFSHLSQESQKKLFKFQLDIDPADRNGVDIAIQISAKPVNVVYNYPLIHRTVSFIVDPIIQGGSSKKFLGINLKAKSQLEWVLKYKKSISLDLDVHAPNILLPENVCVEGSPMLVVILGHFRMATLLTLHKVEELEGAATQFERDDDWTKFYDAFILKISRLQMLLATSTEKSIVLSDVDRNLKSKYHILEPIDAEVSLRICKINTESLPKVKIDGILPSLQLKITSLRLKALLTFIVSVVNQLNQEKPKAMAFVKPKGRLILSEQSFTENLLKVTEQTKQTIELKGTIVEGNFTAPEAFVSLLQDNSQNPEIAVVRLGGMGVSFDKSQYDFRLKASLHSLVIEDKLQTFGDQCRYLATSFSREITSTATSESDEETDLIIVQYSNISSKSPYYENTDQFLVMTFNELSLIVNRQTVAKLIFFVSQIAPETKTISVETIEMDDEEPVPEYKPKPRVDPNHTVIKITAVVRAITVLLNQEEGNKAVPFASATLSNSTMDLFVKDGSLFIEGHLGTLSTHDLSQLPSKYKHILDIKGDNMIDFTFSINECKDVENVKDEYKIGLTFSSLRFIYMESFVSELLTYLSVFGDIFEKTRKALVSYISEFYQTPTKIFRYDVKLKEPLLIFPLSALSSDVIVADLGKISVQNSFCRQNDEYSLIEEIAIEVNNCNLFTASISGAKVSPRDDLIDKGLQIVKHTSAYLSIERLTDLTDTRHKHPDMTIHIFVPSVILCVSLDEVNKILKMWRDNLLVQPSQATLNELRRKIKLTEENKLKRMQSSASIAKETEKKVTVWTTLMLSLEIGVISLEVLEPSSPPSAVATASNTTPRSFPASASASFELLTKLELKNFELLMNATSNDLFNIEVDVWSLRIYDMRPSSNVAKEFRAFVIPIKRDEENPHGQLVVKYLRHPNGKQDILVTLDRFRAVLIPEISMRLLNILRITQTRLNKVLERRAKWQLLLKPDHTQEKAAPMPGGGGTVMRVVITKPQFCLVDDITTTDTKAFVIHSNVTFGMSSNDKGQRISIMLQGTEIFKTTLSKSVKPLSIAIIEPFDTKFDLQIGADSFDALIDIRPVRMVFSYSDFKVLLKAARSWTSQMSSSFQELPDDDEEVVKPSTESNLVDIERVSTDETQSDETSFDSDELFNIPTGESEDEQISSSSSSDEEKQISKKESLKELKKIAEKKTKDMKKEDEDVSSSKSKHSKHSLKKEEKDERKDVTRDSISKEESLTKKLSKEHKERKDERNSDSDSRTKQNKDNSEKISVLKTSSKLRPVSGSSDNRFQTSERSSPTKATEISKMSTRVEALPRTLSNIRLPESKPKRQTALVNQHQIEVLFIDDSKGIDVPFFRFHVNKWSASFADWSQQLQVTAKIETNIVYFNADRDTWEPFIEPWELNVKMIGSAIDLVSDRKLDLNFTKSLLKTLQNAMQTWSMDIKQTPVRTSDMQAAVTTLGSPKMHQSTTSILSSLEFSKNEYYVHNLTGVKLKYWTAHMEPRELEPNQKEPLVLSTDLRQRAEALLRRGLGTGQKVILSFQLEGYETKHSVPIHHVERFSVDTSDGARVIVSVTYEKGSKVVHISSPITIENLTDVDISLLVEFTNRKPIHLPVVKPHQKEHIPIPYIKDGQLHFRPHNRGYQWSSLSCVLAKLELRTTKPLLCLPKDTTKAPFLISINVDKDIDPMQEETRDYHIISMAAPLIIENLLSCKLEYQLCDKKNETILEKGELEKGSRVSLYHFEHTQELSLAVRLPGFNWSKQEMIASQKSKDLAQRILLLDNKDRPLYINIDNNEVDGTRTILLWCSYWIVNRTGLPLQFAERKGELAAGQLEPPENWDAILAGEPRDWYFEDYLQSPPLLFSTRDRGRLHLRLSNSVWSKGLGIQNASNVVAFVELLEKVKGDNSPQRLFEFSVVEYAARNKFWRTKVITFTPRYILVNKLNKTLYINQSNTNSVYSLLPHERTPFHWVNGNVPEKTLRIRINVGNCPWSGAFKLTEMGFFPLQMLDTKTKKPYFVRVRTKIDNGIVTILFTEEEDNENALFKIENRLDVDISVSQKDVPEYTVTLKPGQSQLWGWFEPLATRQVELQISGYSRPIVHQIDKIKEHRRKIRWTDADGHKKEAVIFVKASGSTRVLQLKPKGIELHKDDQKEIETFRVTAAFTGVGISVINEKPEELLYITFEGLMAEYITYVKKQSIEVGIKDCQIDNQLATAYHPVLLYSTAEKPPQFLKFCMIKNNAYPNILYLSYLSLLVREMNVLVDEEIVLKLLSFIDVTLETLHDKNVSEIEELNPLEPRVIENEANARIVYQELVHLNPIRLNLTFTAIKHDENHDQISNTLARMLLKIPDKLLPNVENAPIVLNALVIGHTFTTQDDLTTSLTEHYKSRFLRQLYKILGSVDVLGNPISLIKNLGTGVRDFFYEPAKGITVSPKEFGTGLAKGTKSLVKKSIYAVFNAATKITGSLGKGVAILSLDKDYQQKRQIEKHRQKPRNVLEGVGYGLKDFGTGLFHGVTGLVTQPVKGAMEEGAMGLLKGFGRGIAGIIVKPSVGAIDLITRTTEGVRNTTMMGDKKVERKRPPRYFATGARLRTYSLYEAEGQELLHSLGSFGEYWDHVYWYHEEFDRKRVLLLSDKAVFYIKRKRIEWKTPWSNIQDMQIGPEPNQIRLVLVRKASFMDTTNEKIVTCQSAEQATKVLRTVQDSLERWRTLTKQTNNATSGSQNLSANNTNVNSAS